MWPGLGPPAWFGAVRALRGQNCTYHHTEVSRPRADKTRAWTNKRGLLAEAACGDSGVVPHSKDVQLSAGHLAGAEARRVTVYKNMPFGQNIARADIFIKSHCHNNFDDQDGDATITQQYTVTALGHFHAVAAETARAGDRDLRAGQLGHGQECAATGIFL
jgi:hypothetical protein